MLYTLLLMVGGALGFFLGMANPLYQVPWLALLFPVALMLLGRKASSRPQAFRLGWTTGLLGWAGVLYWVALPVHEFGMLPWGLAVPCVFLLSAYMALYCGLFSVLAHEIRCKALANWAGVMILGTGWYLLEWLRGWLFSGFAWAPLASAFSGSPSMIQGASVVGAYGLGGLFAGLACLGGLGLALGSRRGLFMFSGAAAGFLALWISGVAVMREFRGVLPDAGGVDVLLVQGNVNQHVKWEPAMQRATVARYIELSRGAAAKRQDRQTPALIVWPETSMPFDMEHAHDLALPLRILARGANVSLVVGSVGVDALSGKYINRAYLVHTDGSNGPWYEKEHLVPFGEYAPPFLNFSFLEPLFQGVGTFVPGKSVLPWRLREAGGAALVPGALICYESIFPELARERVAEGADVLVNISNDAWFGRTSAPVQHLHATLLRAVEQGRPLLRSTNTGISAVIDARGRILMQSRLFTADVLSASIRPETHRTLFFRLAPWLPGLAFVAFVLLWLPGRQGKRRRLL